MILFFYMKANFQVVIRMGLETEIQHPFLSTFFYEKNDLCIRKLSYKNVMDQQKRSTANIVEYLLHGKCKCFITAYKHKGFRIFTNLKMNIKSMRRPKNTATLSIVLSMTTNWRLKFGRKRTSLRILKRRNVRKTDRPKSDIKKPNCLY